MTFGRDAADRSRFWLVNSDVMDAGLDEWEHKDQTLKSIRLTTSTGSSGISSSSSKTRHTRIIFHLQLLARNSQHGRNARGDVQLQTAGHTGGGSRSQSWPNSHPPLFITQSRRLTLTIFVSGL